MEKDEIKPIDDIEESLNKSTIYYNNLKLAKSYKFDIFNPVEDLKNCKNFSMTITSKRRTGKSVFVKDIVSKIKGWYTQAYVFSMTSDLQPDLYDFVSKENIYNGFNESKLEQIWKSQEQLVMSMRKNRIADEKIPHILIIFDDLISDPKVRNSEILKRFYVAGRHILMAQAFLSQNFTSIPPIMRNNVDVSVAFYLDSQDNRESFSKQYLSCKNSKLGEMIFNNITKTPYQAIVCLNYITSQDPTETTKTYIASLKVGKFKVGNKNIGKNTFMIDSISPAQIDGTKFIPKIKKGGIKL